MSQINSNIKDDFQVVLLLSCFVGHPVGNIINDRIYILHLNFNLLALVSISGKNCTNKYVSKVSTFLNSPQNFSYLTKQSEQYESFQSLL